jgi:hypothetical protein
VSVGFALKKFLNIAGAQTTHTLNSQFTRRKSNTNSESLTTGYDWTRTSSTATSETKTFEVAATAPAGMVLTIEQAVGYCGGSTIQTELFRITHYGSRGQILRQEMLKELGLNDNTTAPISLFNNNIHLLDSFPQQGKSANDNNARSNSVQGIRHSSSILTMLLSSFFIVIHLKCIDLQ